MHVQVLHIADCPGWIPARDRVRAALDGRGLTDVPVELVEVRTAREAAELPFAGSPTILVDGVDLFPGAEPVADLACRVYVTEDGLGPAPDRGQLEVAMWPDPQPPLRDDRGVG